tara:strand:+ start:1088 stop:2011 length:924 start_codon:yes stop_codon:yes gene_type:complete
MFYNKFDYNKVCLENMDISLYGGIPKQYSSISNKKFNNWEIPPWELIIFKQRLLGEGSFSKVYLAKWRETYVVAKIINKEICNSKKKLVLREFDIMTKLHHPNIVQFLGYIDDPFIIVMEYIPNNDLYKNIINLKKDKKISIMKDILRGLAYIHNRKPDTLIHRDIKPTNILLTNSKVAKITDFGLSRFYNMEKINSHENLNSLDVNHNKCDNLINEFSGFVGTERYMAPEVLKNLSNYNHKIDIYSCGILLYELFENKKYISGSKFAWFWTPKKIKNIILTNMLSQNPLDRKEALDILKIMNHENI